MGGDHARSQGGTLDFSSAVIDCYPILLCQVMVFPASSASNGGGPVTQFCPRKWMGHMWGSSVEDSVSWQEGHVSRGMLVQPSERREFCHLWRGIRAGVLFWASLPILARKSQRQCCIILSGGTYCKAAPLFIMPAWGASVPWGLKWRYFNSIYPSLCMR